MASEFAFPLMIPKLYHKLRPVADGTYAAHLYAVPGTRRTNSTIQVVKRCTILITLCFAFRIVSLKAW